ncbi:MAG: hypothetical protein QM749_17660 [Aquabacterium sp.]
MSRDALELAYARAQLELALYRMGQIDCAWMVEAWAFRCREVAARLLDTGEPLLLF